MNRRYLLVAMVFLMAGGLAFADSSVGFGPRVFKTLDSLPNPYKDAGLGGTIDYTFSLADLLRAQLAYTFFEDGYAGSKEEVSSPQAALLFGDTVYAGAGLGILLSNGDTADHPFALLRLGALFELSPDWDLDLNLSYELGAWNGIRPDFDPQESDTLIGGICLRLNL